MTISVIYAVILYILPERKATFSLRMGSTSMAFISSLRWNPETQKHREVSKQNPETANYTNIIIIIIICYFHTNADIYKYVLCWSVFAACHCSFYTKYPHTILSNISIFFGTLYKSQHCYTISMDVHLGYYSVQLHLIYIHLQYAVHLINVLDYWTSVDQSEEQIWVT